VNPVTALLLGVLQGVTEFWPISSSAHLALVLEATGWGGPRTSFIVALHLGTLAAVVIHYRGRILSLAGAWWRSLLRREEPQGEAHLAWMLLLATLPALAIGALFSRISEELQGIPLAIAAFMGAFGILLWTVDSLAPSALTLEGVDWRRALAMGMAQSLALAPGVSRSGAVMCAARAAGLRREDAADFAFLMSVPVIAAAGVFEAAGLISEGITARDLLAMGVGTLSSAVAGLLAIRYLLRWLKGRGLAPFAIYRVAFSLALVALLLAR